MNTLQTIAGRVAKATRSIGVGLVVLGAIACVAPLASGIAVALLVGLVLLAAGGVLVLFGLSAREAGKGNVGLVIGGLAGICGLVLLVQPSAGLSVVRVVLVAYLLASGGSETALALRLRPDEGWSSALVAAAVSVAAGLMLWFDWPLSGARAIGLLVRSKLIAGGWAIIRLQRTVGAVGERLRSIGRDAAA